MRKYDTNVHYWHVVHTCLLLIDPRSGDPYMADNTFAQSDRLRQTFEGLYNWPKSRLLCFFAGHSTCPRTRTAKATCLAVKVHTTGQGEDCRQARRRWVIALQSRLSTTMCNQHMSHLRSLQLQGTTRTSPGWQCMLRFPSWSIRRLHPTSTGKLCTTTAMLQRRPVPS